MAPSGAQVGDELPTLTPARPKRDPFHDGNEIRLNPIATSRKEEGQAIERPAELTLVVENLAPEVQTEDCALVFTRPYGAALPLLILTIIAGAILFIGGTIFTILSLSGAF